MANYYQIPNAEKFAYLPRDVRNMIEDFANLHHENKEMSNTSFEIAKILHRQIPPSGDIRFAEIWDMVYRILETHIGHKFEEFVLNYKIYIKKINDPNMSYGSPEDLQLYGIYSNDVYKQIEELVDMTANVYSISLNPPEYLNIQKIIWNYVNLLPSEALTRLNKVGYKISYESSEIEAFATMWEILNIENIEHYIKHGIL